MQKNVAQGEVSIRVYLSPESKNRLKTTCFLQGLNMSDVVAELIEDWLEKHPIDAPTPSPKKRQTAKAATANKTKRNKASAEHGNTAAEE